MGTRNTDGISHEPIKEMIEKMKAGDYVVFDHKDDDRGTLSIDVFISRPNPPRFADHGLIIESANKRDLTENNRTFTTYLYQPFALDTHKFAGVFTEEEWEFILSLKLPYNNNYKLTKVTFNCYK